MKMFPILAPMHINDERKVEAAGFRSLRSIPWDMIASHEAQAERNHGQTLSELAGRCGLSACEALAVIEDRPWSQMPIVESYTKLDKLVREYCALRR